MLNLHYLCHPGCMKARWPTTCVRCRGEITVGAQMARPYGKPPWHMSCWLKYRAERKAASTIRG